MVNYVNTASHITKVTGATSVVATMIAAPFCVRARAFAPVSMPLVWPEVKKGLQPRQFTIRNAIARLEQRGDPMAPLLTLKPALQEALAKLLT